MIALLRVFAFVMVLVAAGAGYAQSAAPAPSPPPQKSAEALDTKELKALVDTLKDDQARNKFVEQLEALLKARQVVEGAQSGDAEAATWLSSLADRLRDAVDSVLAAGAAVADLPKLLDDIVTGFSDEATRTGWLEILAKIAVILIAGYAAYYAVGFLLWTPRRAIEARKQESVWACGLFSLLRAVLDLLPLVAFGGAALAVVSLTEPERATRLAALALINAKLATGGIMVVARFFLAPQAENLRLFPMTGETAQYLHIWCGRIAYVAVHGYFLLAALHLLGLSVAIHGFLLNALGLGVTILLIILILQNRDAVSHRIRTPQDSRRSLAAIRRPLAATWHWLAVFYVVALYLVLAVRGVGGTSYILQGTIFTVVIAALAWGLESIGQRAIHRGLTINDELRGRFPGLQTRLNRYTLAIDYTLRAVVFSVAAVAVLEAWGVEAFVWIVSATGGRAVASVANILVISVLATVIWEVASSLIERRLSGNAEGRAAMTRARTLLPLAQTALKIVLLVLVTMVILAEVGVDITPLLAGAGVVGLAVGFGAQKLVQDVITGWFILMEDTIAVGDVAEVAGHAGLVERINIRTIRLRDLSGVVHTIPFSAVDSVKNFTKDFSYYLFEVGVAYREDTDEVVEVLREIDAEMREDPDYGPDILESLEVMGVDRFEDSAVIVRVRTKTKPLRQWAVGREFNRRMKKAFDARGIEIPFPHRTVYFGVAKDDTAPPAHLRIEKDLSEAFTGRDPERERKSDREKPSQGREKEISEDDASDSDAPP